MTKDRALEVALDVLAAVRDGDTIRLPNTELTDVISALREVREDQEAFMVAADLALGRYDS